MEEKSLFKLLIIAVALLAVSAIGNIVLYTSFIDAQDQSPIYQVSGSTVVNNNENTPKELSYLDYSGTMMEGADLSNAAGYKAVFTGADLRNADLHGARFTLADFSGADLSNTDLIGVKFDYANLKGANLQDADLRYADLRGAELDNADLTGAIIEGADIRWVTGNFTR
ncbi:pentapeptide repeat-containing protein [Methanoplanus endosymbiosus]|uniref:Pentapeptide repeat-containing protein n=1 Tax=Methanoplanus endosymbiosus TaxID=33865 RepID=A0A9E7PKN6_9EURY|nr:pentapeptide repeat-containing protein [Methanoplanus endosymbiosus]UUX91913.1 pentapeptide repeat-containing protein [Methanoplanus endosymbiosus]